MYEDDYVGGWRHTRARLHTFYAAAALDVRRVRTFAARRGASVPQLTCYVPVFSLFKIYGSAHLRTPGKALRSNDPFVEQGDLFERAISRQGTPFGADDLYAAYELLLQTQRLGFGQRKDGSKPTRRVTKFLFCFVFAELLSWILSEARMPSDEAGLTNGILILSQPQNRHVLDRLARLSAHTIDRYMDRNGSHPIDQEKAYREKNMRDISDYLRLEALGTLDFSANLHCHLETMKLHMADGFEDRMPAQEVILAALKADNSSKPALVA